MQAIYCRLCSETFWKYLSGATQTWPGLSCSLKAGRRWQSTTPRTMPAAKGTSRQHHVIDMQRIPWPIRLIESLGALNIKQAAASVSRSCKELCHLATVHRSSIRPCPPWWKVFSSLLVDAASSSAPTPRGSTPSTEEILQPCSAISVARLPSRTCKGVPLTALGLTKPGWTILQHTWALYIYMYIIRMMYITTVLGSEK